MPWSISPTLLCLGVESVLMATLGLLTEESLLSMVGIGLSGPRGGLVGVEGEMLADWGVSTARERLSVSELLLRVERLLGGIAANNPCSLGGRRKCE